MGHIRLGVLPKYPRWKSVIALLDDQGVPPAQVADKVLDGSREVLGSESAQTSVAYCIWLISQLTLASRHDDFSSRLRELGVPATERTNATQFVAAVSYMASRHLSTLAPRTALNNLSGLALREALTRTVGAQANTLFGSQLADVQHSLKVYSTNTQFSSLLHVYFTALVSRVLLFVIDKEIANHLGPDKRFTDIGQVQAFENELEGFAGQTSRIVDTFAGGWYSKRVWQQGAISEADAAGFVRVALRKLSADLKLSGSRQ